MVFTAYCVQNYEANNLRKSGKDDILYLYLFISVEYVSIFVHTLQNIFPCDKLSDQGYTSLTKSNEIESFKIKIIAILCSIYI